MKLNLSKLKQKYGIVFIVFVVLGLLVGGFGLGFFGAVTYGHSIVCVEGICSNVTFICDNGLCHAGGSYIVPGSIQCSNDLKCDQGEDELCKNECVGHPCNCNSVCENGESQIYCPSDCFPPPKCSNNMVCEGTESYLNCPFDCVCDKDNVCEITRGENMLNCLSDCEQKCEDNTVIGYCSVNKPFSCEGNKSLVSLCSICGCPENMVCQSDNTCKEKPEDFWVKNKNIILIVLIVITFLGLVYLTRIKGDE